MVFKSLETGMSKGKSASHDLKPMQWQTRRIQGRRVLVLLILNKLIAEYATIQTAEYLVLFFEP